MKLYYIISTGLFLPFHSISLGCTVGMCAETVGVQVLKVEKGQHG